MSFLNPAGGLVALAIGVPLVLVLYFLKLRRRPVRVSSTLLWERAIRDVEVNVPFRWIRASVALFLQLLAVGAIVAAIARPVWGDAPGASGRVLILIDRSASMSAADGEGEGVGAEPAGGPVTRLDEAKRRAREIVGTLGRAGESAEAMIGQFAASAESLTALTRNAEALREAIDAIAPTDQPDSVEAALRLVSAFAGRDEEGEQAVRAMVFVISDGSLAQREARTQFVPGVDVRFVRVGPAPDEPGPAGTEKSPERWSNLGITALSSRRDGDDPAMVRLFVRVSNASDQPATATLRVRLDDEDAGAIPLTVPGGASEGGLSFAPGEATATTGIPCPLGGVISVSLPPGDLLKADDSAALVIPPARRPRVLVIAPGGEAGAKDAGADPFLRAVLRQLDLGRLEFAGAGTEIAMLGDPEAGPDLIIYDRVAPGALAPIASISLGAGLPTPGLSVGPAPADAGPTRVLSWRRDHPALRFVPLDSVVVNPPMTMRFTTPSRAEGDGARGSSTDFTPLAEGETGPLIALVETQGVRRIVVGFDQERANWGPSPAFPVFLSNSVDFLTLRGESQAGRAASTAEAVSVGVLPGAKAIEAAGPMRLRIGPIPPGTTSTTLGVLERAGIYRLSGSAEADRVVAANLCSAGETNLRTAPTIPLSGDFQAGEDGPTQRRSGVGERAGGAEIWHWCVGAALVLLTLEWFWLAWRMRV